MKATFILETGVTYPTSTRIITKGNPPALLWAEIVRLLSEYAKFENNENGTRFDTWLNPKDKE